MRVLSICGHRRANSLCLSVLADPAWAGFPSPAADYEADRLDLNDFLIVNPPATYIMRVAGHSMQGEHIADQDFLIVDRSVTPISGTIVVAVVEGEFTVKQFFQQGQYRELRSAHPDYPPLRILGEIEVTIWGVVTGVFRKLV